MRPDIINAPALQNAINELLEGGTPPSLQGHITALKSCLRKAAENHCSVRKARRRKKDPAWAQQKFNDGHTLYRFNKSDEWLDHDIKKLVEELNKVAEIALEGGVLSGPANAFLRGLSHSGHGDMDELLSSSNELVNRAEMATYRAQRHDVLRDPACIVVDGFIGSLCVSIDEIIRLGREAKNCLVDSRNYWKGFRARDHDFWAVRQGNRLIAILRVERHENRVVEALGPENRTISLNDVRQVATFCKEAGLQIGTTCDGLRAEYAAPFQVDPTPVKIKGYFAIYAEWPTAVRIDMRKEDTSSLSIFHRNKVLELSFSPQRSCLDMVFEGDDHLYEVKKFGRKKIRKILGHVAMSQTEPTLVQHRLLALAA
jgi:hypothetical protein